MTPDRLEPRPKPTVTTETPISPLGEDLGRVGFLESTTDQRLAFYQQELDVFKKTEPMLILSGKISANEQGKLDLRLECDQKVANLEANLDTFIQTRKSAQSNLAKINAEYDANPNSIKAHTYRVLRLFFLDPLADKLFPFDSTDRKIDVNIEKSEATKEELRRTTQKEIQRANYFDDQLAMLRREERENTEVWAARDRERTLMYAFSNPGRAKTVFAIFASKNEAHRDEVFKQLQKDLALIVANEQMQSVSTKTPQDEVVSVASHNSTPVNNFSYKKEQIEPEEEVKRRPIIIEGLNSSTFIENRDQLIQVLKKSESEISPDELIEIIDKLATEEAMLLVSQYKKRVKSHLGAVLFGGYRVVRRGKVGRVLFDIDNDNNLHIRIGRHTKVYGPSFRSRRTR